MKPSSLATVLIRLAALYIFINGALMICVVIALYLYLSSLTANNSLHDLTARVSGFEGSSSGGATLIHVASGLLVCAVGYMLDKYSARLGAWIARGLQ